MSARNAGGQETATARGTDSDKEKPTAGSGGGPHKGRCYVLWAIEPNTLPESDPWPEVRRRIAAYEADRDGWRTGEIQNTLGEAAGGEKP